MRTTQTKATAGSLYTIAAIAAAVGGFLVALPGLAQWTGTAHWKSTIEVEGGGREGMGPMSSEIWSKGGKMRMKTSAMGMEMNVVKSGDTIYQWTDGQKAGMKFNAAVARQQSSGDYANRIEEYRTKGKKVGSEKVDGHSCDIYELTTPAPGGDRKERVWLATDLKNFPIKGETEAGGGKVSYHNTDIDFSGSIADSMLVPPTDVEFRDMSDLMKGRGK